jgi:hypothetical protein
MLVGFLVDNIFLILVVLFFAIYGGFHVITTHYLIFIGLLMGEREKPMETG